MILNYSYEYLHHTCSVPTPYTLHTHSIHTLYPLRTCSIPAPYPLRTEPPKPLFPYPSFYPTKREENMEFVQYQVKGNS